MTEEIFLKKLGKRITSYRKAIKMSKQELANNVGISRMQIYRIETGSADGNPSILVLKKIADVFEISVSELTKIK